jgi:hypothetical protein
MSHSKSSEEYYSSIVEGEKSRYRPGMWLVRWLPTRARSSIHWINPFRTVCSTVISVHKADVYHTVHRSWMLPCHQYLLAHIRPLVRRLDPFRTALLCRYTRRLQITGSIHVRYFIAVGICCLVVQYWYLPERILITHRIDIEETCTRGTALLSPFRDMDDVPRDAVCVLLVRSLVYRLYIWIYGR